MRVESGASLAPGALFDRAISELSHWKTHTHTHTTSWPVNRAMDYDGL